MSTPPVARAVSIDRGSRGEKRSRKGYIGRADRPGRACVLEGLTWHDRTLRGRESMEKAHKTRYGLR